MPVSDVKTHKSIPAVWIVVAVAIFGALFWYFTYHSTLPSSDEKKIAIAEKAHFDLAVNTVKMELSKAASGASVSTDIVALLNQGGTKSPANGQHAAFVGTHHVQDDGQTMISPVNINQAVKAGQPVTVTPARALQKVNPAVIQITMTIKPGQGVVVLPPQS